MGTKLILNLNLVLFFFVNLSFAQNKSKVYNEGVQFFQEERYEEALTSFKKESKKQTNLELKFWIASCYFKQEKFSEAKEGFLKITSETLLEPESAMSLVNLGSCYRELQKNDSAFYYYNLAIKHYPEMADSYFNKGQLVRTLGDLNEARELFNLALKYDSLNWVYYMKRMEICFIQNDYKYALIDLLKAKELNPQFDIRFNLAYCYSMLEEFEKADSIYTELYAEKENNASFLNNYGFNKCNLGQEELGITYINKSLAINPNNSYAYRNLAIVFIKQNHIEEACKNIQKSLELKFSENYGMEVVELRKKYCER